MLQLFDKFFCGLLRSCFVFGFGSNVGIYIHRLNDGVWSSKKKRILREIIIESKYGIIKDPFFSSKIRKGFLQGGYYGCFVYQQCAAVRLSLPPIQVFLQGLHFCL